MSCAHRLYADNVSLVLNSQDDDCFPGSVVSAGVNANRMMFDDEGNGNIPSTGNILYNSKILSNVTSINVHYTTRDGVNLNDVHTNLKLTAGLIVISRPGLTHTFRILTFRDNTTYGEYIVKSLSSVTDIFFDMEEVAFSISCGIIGNDGHTGPTGDTIYNTDGIITSSRKVEITDNLNFSNLFYIDKINKQISIGHTVPEATFDIKGSFKYVDKNQAMGKLLTSDSEGIGKWTTQFSEGKSIIAIKGSAGKLDFSEAKITHNVISWQRLGTWVSGNCYFAIHTEGSPGLVVSNQGTNDYYFDVPGGFTIDTSRLPQQLNNIDQVFVIGNGHIHNMSDNNLNEVKNVNVFYGKVNDGSNMGISITSDKLIWGIRDNLFNFNEAKSMMSFTFKFPII
jgi:hypothetical protein